MFTLFAVDVQLYGTNFVVVSDEDAAKMRTEEDRRARLAWAKRFEVARATIPPHFAWIDPIKPTAPIPDVWRARLPWLTREHLQKLIKIWRERTNLLICGPPDVGKTCVLVLHAQYTLAHANYDAPEVKATRETLAAWTPKHRLEAPPREPEWLPQVREAQCLRFMSATELLDDKLQGPNETKLREAIMSTALYLDDVGREMGGAKGSGHVASSRRAAVMRVLESRWSNERRFVATTEHTIEELGDMYGGGSFRRIAGERSGAIVVDLGEDEWAGRWLKQRNSARK